MSMTPMEELREAIHRLRFFFEKNRMTPSIIELSSWEDGQSLKLNLDPEHMLYVELGVDEKTGEMKHQCTIEGVIVRWPTRRQVLRDGSFRYT